MPDPFNDKLVRNLLRVKPANRRPAMSSKSSLATSNQMATPRRSIARMMTSKTPMSGAMNLAY